MIKTAGDYNYMCRGQNGEYLNGTIDNIAVWERALNPDEIQYVYGRHIGFGNYYTFKTKDVKTRKGKIDVLELALRSG